MQDIEVYVIIISIVNAIIFGVVIVSIINMGSNIRDIKKLLFKWGMEQGFAYEFTCKVCKKKFTGKQPTCPHCGDEKNYDKSDNH